jgi:hypothetical protein
VAFKVTNLREREKAAEGERSERKEDMGRRQRIRLIVSN